MWYQRPGPNHHQKVYGTVRCHGQTKSKMRRQYVKYSYISGPKNPLEKAQKK